MVTLKFTSGELYKHNVVEYVPNWTWELR